VISIFFNATNETGYFNCLITNGTGINIYYPNGGLLLFVLVIFV